MLLTFILIGQVSTSAIAQGRMFSTICKHESAILGGDGVPWPWGQEMRFPWTRIQGVWAPLSADCDSYFMFNVGDATSGGERFVQITQYDPKTCTNVAVGAGYELNRVIYASMTDGMHSFDLTVRAFDTSVLQSSLSATAPACFDALGDTSQKTSSVVVLTMYPKEKWADRVSYQLEKLKSTPSLLCTE